MFHSWERYISLINQNVIFLLIDQNVKFLLIDQNVIFLLIGQNAIFLLIYQHVIFRWFARTLYDGLVYMSGKHSKNIGSQVNHSVDKKKTICSWWWLCSKWVIAMNKVISVNKMWMIYSWHQVRFYSFSRQGYCGSLTISTQALCTFKQPLSSYKNVCSKLHSVYFVNR